MNGDKVTEEEQSFVYELGFTTVHEAKVLAKLRLIAFLIGLAVQTITLIAALSLFNFERTISRQNGGANGFLASLTSWVGWTAFISWPSVYVAGALCWLVSVSWPHSLIGSPTKRVGDIVAGSLSGADKLSKRGLFLGHVQVFLALAVGSFTSMFVIDVLYGFPVAPLNLLAGLILCVGVSVACAIYYDVEHVARRQPVEVKFLMLDHPIDASIEMQLTKTDKKGGDDENKAFMEEPMLEPLLVA